MPYSLLEHGDKTEQEYWPLLKDAWPNYEVLWQQFVVPLTGRPDDIQIRQGADPLLEAMGMMHYSMFYHLGRAHELLEHVSQGAQSTECYDEMFFHMSSSTEMLERFLLVLREMRHTIGFFEKEYSRATAEKLVSGRLSHIRADLKAFLESLDQPEESVNKLWLTVDHIRSYRNVVAHNPRIGRLIDREGLAYLPIQDKLSEYRLWSSVIYRKDARSDFELASVIVTRLLGEFESSVNELWQELITLLTTWSKTEQYEKMLPSEPRGPRATTSEISMPPGLGEETPGSVPPSGVKIRTSYTGTAAAYEDTPDGGVGDPS